MARPLGLLALGIVASAALWAVLLRDGGARAQTEHLTQRDRAALDRVLQHP